MQDEERQIIVTRSAVIDDALLRFRDEPWEERTRTAADQLTAIHGLWWARHNGNPEAYALDLLNLNKLAGLKGKNAAVATVERFLIPPKFFGGDPTSLHPDFVLSVSLNHGTPKGSSPELMDFQEQVSCLKSHRYYFRQTYVYRTFFHFRSTVLSAYAAARRLEIPNDWRRINERYALYIENYPFWSANFSMKSTPALRQRVEAESFVAALNRLTRKVVFGLLQPRVILLAGQDTWSLLPRHQPELVSERIRVDQSCFVELDRLELIPGAPLSTICRCNFLRTVYGPNSYRELENLGSLLAE